MLFARGLAANSGDSGSGCKLKAGGNLPAKLKNRSLVAWALPEGTAGSSLALGSSKAQGQSVLRLDRDEPIKVIAFSIQHDFRRTDAISRERAGVSRRRYAYERSQD